MNWLQRLLDMLREWLRRQRLADRPAYEWHHTDFGKMYKERTDDFIAPREWTKHMISKLEEEGLV